MLFNAEVTLAKDSFPTVNRHSFVKFWRLRRFIKDLEPSCRTFKLTTDLAKLIEEQVLFRLGKDPTISSSVGVLSNQATTILEQDGARTLNLIRKTIRITGGTCETLFPESKDREMHRYRVWKNTESEWSSLGAAYAGHYASATKEDIKAIRHNFGSLDRMLDEFSERIKGRADELRKAVEDESPKSGFWERMSAWSSGIMRNAHRHFRGWILYWSNQDRIVNAKRVISKLGTALNQHTSTAAVEAGLNMLNSILFVYKLRCEEGDFDVAMETRICDRLFGDKDEYKRRSAKIIARHVESLKKLKLQEDKQMREIIEQTQE